MTETHENKPPIWFWVVSGLALVWNLLGVGAYISQVTMSEEALAKLPEADQAMMAAQPAWLVAAFAIAVFAGALGCLFLLLRKKWALPVLIVSFIGVLAQQLYFFVLTEVAFSLEGPALVMTILIPVISIFLVWFARKSASRGWIK